MSRDFIEIECVVCKKRIAELLKCCFICADCDGHRKEELDAFLSSEAGGALPENIISILSELSKIKSGG